MAATDIRSGATAGLSSSAVAPDSNSLQARATHIHSSELAQYALGPPESGAVERVFLTAAWRNLIMLNWHVDAALLTRWVPAGVELDLWQGLAPLSIVGFQFLDSRLLG